MWSDKRYYKMPPPLWNLGEMEWRKNNKEDNKHRKECQVMRERGSEREKDLNNGRVEAETHWRRRWRCRVICDKQSHPIQCWDSLQKKICFLFAGLKHNPGRSIFLTLKHTPSVMDRARKNQWDLRKQRPCEWEFKDMIIWYDNMSVTAVIISQWHSNAHHWSEVPANHTTVSPVLDSLGKHKHARTHTRSCYTTIKCSIKVQKWG